MTWQTTTHLYSWQQRAVDKLLPSRVSGLLMDMGTGKTRTAIEFARLRQRKINRVVWFCPVSLKETAEQEILKHTDCGPDHILVFDDRTGQKDLPERFWNIIGLESMSSSNRVTLAAAALIDEWTFVIVDESSYIKGHHARRTERITRLSDRARYRMILTGTPLSQGVVDLYAQMRFLSPKILGYNSFYSFARNHLEYHPDYPGPVDSLPDFRVAAHIAADAQTILFNSEQALALRPALERFADEVDYRLPFPNVILQFTSPIPETVFFAEERSLAEITGQNTPDTTGDSVLCLLLHQHEGEDTINQAAAYFRSTAINRVMWTGNSLHYFPDANPSDLTRANKERLRALAVACIAYINCINLMLERHEPDERVNRKRAAKGKRVLQPYYTVTLRPEYRREGDGAGGPGSSHGHRYDVRGHFRRLGDGRLTWVRPHQRGLAHEEYIPAVRRVGGEQ